MYAGSKFSLQLLSDEVALMSEAALQVGGTGVGISW